MCVCVRVSCMRGYVVLEDELMGCRLAQARALYMVVTLILDLFSTKGFHTRFWRNGATLDFSKIFCCCPQTDSPFYPRFVLGSVGVKGAETKVSSKIFLQSQVVFVCSVFISFNIYVYLIVHLQHF